jgi:hypothetical protein
MRKKQTGRMNNTSPCQNHPISKLLSKPSKKFSLSFARCRHWRAQTRNGVEHLLEMAAESLKK